MKKVYISPQCGWVSLGHNLPLMVGGSVSDKLDPLEPETAGVNEEIEWKSGTSIWDEEW